METDTKGDVRYRRLVRIRGVRMLWVSTIVERGTVHYGSTEEACPIPSGEVMDSGCSSLSFFSKLSIHRPILKAAAAAASSMNGNQISSSVINNSLVALDKVVGYMVNASIGCGCDLYLFIWPMSYLFSLAITPGSFCG